MKSKYKQKFSSVIDNNLFILKIVWKISKSRFILNIFTSVISAVLPALNILITRHILKHIEGGEKGSTLSFSQVLGFVILLMCIQVLPRIFSAWNTTLIEPLLASKINKYVNELFIEKSKMFEYEDFENPIFYDKYTRGLNQSETITHAVFNNFFGLLSAVIGMLSLGVLIFSMDGVIIFFAIFSVLANFIQSLFVSKLNYDTQVVLTPVVRKQSYIKRLLYIPDYAKDIKCSNLLNTGKQYYTQAFQKVVHIIKQYGFKIALMNTGIIFLSFLSSAIMMILLFIRVWKGIYLISDFTALTSSITQLEHILNCFLTTITALYADSMYIDDFKFIYNYSKSTQEIECEELDASVPAKIEFKNVYFRYPNANKYALSNVSFTILPGEKVSIVGLNGSGKTTLIKLLLRFYEPEKGAVYINDIDIRKYKKESLQKNIGTVFQDHHVYAYTIKENISFDEEIKDSTFEVLERLELNKVIYSLPQEYNTHLSKEFFEEGINLSGGENQKICIARAFNQAAGIYVFDEPSSALDIFAENKMNEVMMTSSSKTMIFISHRLSTVIMADNIIVLQDGKVIEMGNHTELLNSNGLYANLYKEQAKHFL